MREIQTVALLGAGAVGGYFISGLSDKLGDRLWVVAEGDRKRRLEQEGIVINSVRFPLHVRTPQEAHGADLLLVSLKYGALEGSLPAIRQVVGPETLVMSLMNGVDSEEIIGRAVGMEHMLYAMMKIASERKGNEIVFNEAVTQGVFFGEAGQAQPSPRVQAVSRLFEGTRVRYTVCPDILRDIWFKYALNISKNLPQAIVGCGYGAYQESAYVARISDALRREVAQVAEAKGIDIWDEHDPMGRNSALSPKARFSTLQDLDAKRHTEIEMFSGTLIRMGKELGIPTPYNDFAYCAIKAMEEKNDGKFDW